MPAQTIVGERGEFSVWFNDRKILEKGFILLPSEKKILAAVRKALAENSSAG